MKVVDIPIPEPDLTREMMIERARKMVPALRERAEECDRLRRLPEETLHDFLEAGFFRICQPRRFGGYEFDLVTLSEVMIEISRGCGSSGWVLSLTAAHNWWAAMYPKEGQVELFGKEGDLRFPLIFAPQGQATQVEGGYELSGRWNYASGCDVTNWLGVNAIVENKTEEIPDGLAICIIKSSEYEIHDNWHVMGLRGTGSKQAVIEKVFVPHHRALLLQQLEETGSPGAILHKNPFYQGPALPIFCTEIASVAVGIAQAALDVYDERARNKTSPFKPGIYLSETQTAQTRIARATAIVDAAKALLKSETISYMNQVTEAVSENKKIPLEERFRMQLQMQYVLNTCAEAVDILFVAGGTSAMADGQPLQRCFRDINAIRTHYLMDYDRGSENWGRIHFGFEPTSRTPGI